MMNASFKPKLKKILVALGIIAAIFTLLVGMYVIGGIYYPESVQKAYQQQDCETVLHSYDIITRFYPYRSLQEDTTGWALECALYTNAKKLQEAGDWQEAYKTYKTCAATYPVGLLAVNAQEQAAVSLLMQAQEQQEQKKYPEAIKTIKQVMAEYPSRIDAINQYAEVHLSWSSEYQLREEFQAAEDVLLSLLEWGTAGQYDEHIAKSQTELSGLYLAWGENHQNAGELAPAMVKYGQAVDVAPDSASASRAAEKQVEILLTQGDTYMDAGDYQAAIDVYQRGVSDANESGKDRLHTATAQAYLAWAKHNVEREDYYQALEKIESAGLLPLPEMASGEVESFKQEVYTAFAGSSGTQATRLIQDAARTMCKNEKKTFPPALGIDPDASKLILYGIDESLSEEWIAKTPGQLKYVVCVTLNTEVFEERKRELVRYGEPGGTYFHSFLRLRYIWQVNVFSIISSEIIQSTVFKGSEPPPFDPRINDKRVFIGWWYGRYLSLPPSVSGSQPDINELMTWLKEMILK